MNLKRFSLAAGVALCATSALAQNLFVNGDFEINPGVSSGSSRTFNGTNAQATGGLDGWFSTLSQGGVSTPSNYIAGANRPPFAATYWAPVAASGQYSVQLDSASGTAGYSIGNTIYQTVSLTANVPYVLTFAYHGETVKSPGDVSTLRALISLESSPANFLSTNVFTYDGYTPNGGDTGNPRTGDPGWSNARVVFTPTTSGDYRFTFLDGTGPQDNNMSLDNISLMADLSAIPETSTWVGLGLLGALAAGWQHRAGLRGLLRRLNLQRA